jgi:hypothetical protein
MHVRVAMVACDLDGTVLGPGAEIAPEARTALGEAAAAGTTIVLASGRMLRSVQGVQAQLGVGGPIIAYNGGLVALPDGRRLHHPIPVPVAQLVADVCADRGFFLQTYQDDALYVPHADPRADAYSALAGVPHVVDPDRVFHPGVGPTKLLVIEPPERQPEVRAHLAPLAPGQLELAHSYPHYLEITALGVDKGTALIELCGLIGVGLDAVLAVGDGENDLPMLRLAGVPVAVANAQERVRQIVARVTTRPYGAGVAEALAMGGVTGG